ncbi:MAG: alpha/beta hydrolase-fold protein [Bacteroidota bacterium]|nr:alpha/beta hydrolase-fold protein [Bacteroidota bacterium]
MRFVILILISSFSILLAQNNIDNGYTKIAADKKYGEFIWFHSDSMNKDFPCLVFLPTDYKNNKKEYPVVYMLHGYNNSPFTEEGIRSMNNSATGILEAANEFQVIIVCPLVGNKYYINSPIFKEQKYASLIGTELVQMIDNKYRTKKDRNARILAGFSMGGYGAVSLLCRYPEVFSTAISRGGALDAQSLMDDLNWDDISLEILGDYWQNQKQYHLHSIVNLLNKIQNRNDVSIVLEVGREDFLYTGNKKVEAKLRTTKIPYIFAEYPGGHIWSKNALQSMLTHLQYFNKTK